MTNNYIRLVFEAVARVHFSSKTARKLHKSAVLCNFLPHFPKKCTSRLYVVLQYKRGCLVETSSLNLNFKSVSVVFELDYELGYCLLCIAVDHDGVVHREERVLDAGEACTLTTLEDEYCACLVSVYDRHTVDR